jgi:hypothetical protein
MVATVRRHRAPTTPDSAQPPRITVAASRAFRRGEHAPYWALVLSDFSGGSFSGWPRSQAPEPGPLLLFPSLRRGRGSAAPRRSMPTGTSANRPTSRPTAFGALPDNPTRQASGGRRKDRQSRRASRTAAAAPLTHVRT